MSSQTPGPVLGPCQTWITGDDVAECGVVDGGSDPSVFDLVAVEASMLLFEVSGRQFPGPCQRTVRPCSDGCGCWLGPASYGLGPWFWTSVPWGSGLGGWWWRTERGDRLGCSPMSRVNLAGYPVREILEVRIDGQVLPELDGSGARNYRLDGWRWLTRMDAPPVAPSTTSTPRSWPGCQNMSLDSDQPGTFEVSYLWGTGPDPLGKAAAVELAAQLWLSCSNRDCKLPAGATRVTREGITVDRGLLANWADPRKPVGLVATDAFLQAYWGGSRGGRRGAVWSPDRQQFARPVGTDYAGGA